MSGIIINMVYETVPTRENSPHTPDAIIVLGKNIGVGSTQEDIQADNFNLSRESRMNALAAGMLWRPGMDIIFSTGQTAPGTLSEAEAMRRYMQIHFKDKDGKSVIPEKNIILEETSIDTAGNAEEVALLLKDKSYQHVGLVSVGYHVKNAANLFRRYGVAIEQDFAAENIVLTRSNLHQALIKAWEKSDKVKTEEKKEKVRALLLRTVDRRGKLLRLVTQRTRS